ncbi:MAG TPA: PHB depolymerase family esterase [Candidatus Sulfotelmatobacter sp.]|nr:PHB depolymerase family esterase [Candidatus Sulfotelmatobacter sp.]
MKIAKWWAAPAAVAGLAVLLLAAPSQAQETKEKVTVDDVDRTYLVRLPRGYDAKQKYPVVILLHGMNQDTDDMERLTRFADLADKNGIIAVYPSALHGRWNVGVHPAPPPQRMLGRPGGGHGGHNGGGGYPGGGGGYPGGGGGYPGGGGGGNPQPGGQSGGQGRHEESAPAAADDIDFLNHMLDQMALKFSVDAERIYATGLSEGGLMAMKVGCSMADRVAAIAPVGAAMPKTMICLPSRPLAVVMINGTSDPVVPYGGGTEHNLRVPVVSVEDSAKAWAKMNHCAEKPTQSKLPAHEKGGMETKVETYDGCQQGAQVVSYSVKGAGNTWPGGEQYEVEKEVGKTSPEPNANETIWNFLSTKKIEEKSEPDKTAGDSPSVK